MLGKLSVSGKGSWQFIRRLISKMISVLFEEQVFQLQQILVSLLKLIEGVFKAVWHNVQWEEVQLAVCYVVQSDMLQIIIRGS